MPLDAQVFRLSPRLPLLLKISGAVLLIPSLYFLIKATLDNLFMSTVVRIQADRKQKVISSGVYHFVRLPQYLGIILLIIGGPLYLGSLISIFLGIIMSSILVGRIIGEEKMLVEELDGYREYQK